MSSFRCFFEILFALLNIATLPFVGTCLAEINIAIVTPRQSKANGETLLLYGNQGLVSALLAIETVNNKSDGYFDNILPNTTLRYEFYDSKEDIQTVADLANTIRKNAFGGRGPDIILGAGTSACTMALHSILKHFEILQVSPA